MIENKAKFNHEDLISIFNDTNCHFINDTLIEGIITDSRKITQGNAFLALKGESLDGHSKISDAISAGASFIIAEKSWIDQNPELLNKCNFISVKDTLWALGQLGNYHRLRFSYPIIAVGGSNGKTTTKEITSHILSYKYNVLKTFENFNNQLGVPLMLLALDDSFTAAVLEIGTNEPGEIGILSQMVEPDYGILTNIGKEHLEKLIDLDGVEFEETFLFGYLNKHNKTSIVNLEDERLARYTRVLENFFSFGTKEGNLIYTLELNDNLSPILDLKYENNSVKIEMSAIGLTTGLNSVAGAAVALSLGMTLDEIKKALEEFKTVEYHNYGRMFLENLKDFKILNDCYNANPSSMKASISTLVQFKSEGKKIAVIGDMRELGESSDAEHIDIINFASNNADLVFAFGTEMNKAANLVQLENVSSYLSKDELFNNLIKKDLSNSAILVKGSRGTKMEDIIIKLKEKFN